MSAQRQQQLLSLMQTNPGDVLRVAIPSNVSHTMPRREELLLFRFSSLDEFFNKLYQIEPT